MASQWGFIGKVLLGSLALTLAIKYVAPTLPLSPSSSLSLVMVLTPSVLVGAILGWRAWTSS